MALNVDWKARLEKGLLDSLLPLIVTAAAIALWSRLRIRLQLYDPIVLSAYLATFVAFLLWDWRLSSKRYVWILYSTSAGVFVILTSYARESSVTAYIPILASAALTGFAKLYALSAMHHAAMLQKQLAETVGFAVTGIVICRSNPDEPHFILVLNRNLRGGRGLWVPPGGHFIPHREEPTAKLLFKVATEIGVRCTVIDTSALVQAGIEELTTDRTRWLVVPAFLLDEDLMGKCSHGHEVHIDSVYLLLTDGVITEPIHKYSKSEQITIPVARCGTSFRDTKNAILAAIESWHIQATGAKPGLRETLTNDVVWRLHLSSLLFTRLIGDRKSEPIKS